MTEVTPPVLQGPTSKERKYDRQLRLWAANGQAALEGAHVLLINSGPGVAGIETLKNLVLPGIGQFTILDPTLVTEADLGVNFFLEDEDLGAFRAERCSKWLNELNPDVQGHHISEPFETFITRPDALLPYTLILAIHPLAPEIIEKVSAHSQSLAIPVFYIHSIGFYAHFTVQLPSSFPIVDTHPDPASTTDLRLLEPWPALQDAVKSKTAGLDQMDAEQHGHVPYLLLLLHFLQAWKGEHGGQAPTNYKEKTAFREMVRKGMRTNNAEGGEENFEEAIGAVLKSLNPTSVGSAVKEVFDAPECCNVSAESPDFWIIASAVQSFYKKHGALPLPGSLPDMKAKSADYIELQNIYKSKARADVAEIVKTVHDLKPSVDVKEVEAFCKSSGHIKLVRGRLPQFTRGGDFIAFKDRATFAAGALTDPTSLFPLYITFLAYDSFSSTHSSLDDAASAIKKITSIAHTYTDALIKEAGTFIEDPDYTEIKTAMEKYITDLVNARGGELHNIAAVVGGMVAQEVIKVVTKQYVPVDNTCLFDGVKSRTSVLRL